MTIRENISLATKTTLRVGGPAAHFIDCDTEGDVEGALRFARERSLPYMPLGQGSNVLASDEGYPGVVLHLRIPEFSVTPEGDTTTITCGAGVIWDQLVRQAAVRGLWGIENLAGIPGTVGAAAVQNIGAYGAVLSDTLLWVEAYDAHKEQLVRFTRAECNFGYRMSRFKREPELIIARVAIALTQNDKPNFSYKDLQAMHEAGITLDTPRDIGDAVRAIRSKKFPDLREYGTAGSFFLNPVLPAKDAEQLAARYPGMPLFPMPEGGVKAPIAWILDHRHGVVDLRTVGVGGAFVWPHHALVLATRPGATARDVDALANDIAKRVHDATGITIEREVRGLMRAV